MLLVSVYGNNLDTGRIQKKFNKQKIINAVQSGSVGYTTIDKRAKHCSSLPKLIWLGGGSRLAILLCDVLCWSSLVMCRVSDFKNMLKISICAFCFSTMHILI